MKEKKSNRDSGYVPSREMPESPITVNDNGNATTLPPPLPLPQAQQRQLRLRGLKTCATPSIFFLSLSYFFNEPQFIPLAHNSKKKAQTIQMLWALGIFPQVIFIYLFFVIVYVLRNYINYAHSSSPSDSAAWE